jgi:hypothetical protein
MFNVVSTLQRAPLLVNEGGSFKDNPVFPFAMKWAQLQIAFQNIIIP